MQDFQVTYDKSQSKKYSLFLIIGGLIVAAIGIPVYFFWRNDIRILVFSLILTVGMIVVGIVFFVRTYKNNEAFRYKDGQFFFRGMAFKTSDIEKIDGVINLGRENSLSYLDEFVATPPKPNYYGDIYITAKKTQYRYSYIADIMLLFEKLHELNISSTLVIWAGTSNRKYIYFENQSKEME